MQLYGCPGDEEEGGCASVRELFGYGLRGKQLDSRVGWGGVGWGGNMLCTYLANTPPSTGDEDGFPCHRSLEGGARVDEVIDLVVVCRCECHTLLSQSFREARRWWAV